jgi:hypothetical protein
LVFPEVRAFHRPALQSAEHGHTAAVDALGIQLEERMYRWGEEVESNAVEVHVHHLRRKLGADIVKTIRGVGYVMPRGKHA